MKEFDDILYYNYTGIKNHKKMDALSRASSFNAFDALEGYSKLIDDANIIYKQRKILLNDKLNELDIILNEIDNNTLIVIEYFKDNNIFIEEGYIAYIDEIYKYIVFNNNKIYIQDIYNIIKKDYE